MTEPPRDWDRELAKVDRVIAQQQSAAPPSVADRLGHPVQRRFVALTWFWSGLAVLLAIALLVWPYDKNCGIRLIFFPTESSAETLHIHFDMVHRKTCDSTNSTLHRGRTLRR